jgi:hypothetical protein
MMLIEPGTTTLVDMIPYEMQYAYIPIDKLQTNTDYKIHAAFDGGYSVEIMMKRKDIETKDHLG